jgi:hypothetical protein
MGSKKKKEKIMNQTIIALSGKKQSGKNTSCNFIVGLVMTSLGITKRMDINENGQLYVYDILGDKSYEGIFDMFRNTPTMKNFLAQYLDPFVKAYSFADPLKQLICLDILGMSYEDVYTELGKQSLSKIKWEDLPLSNKNHGYLTNREVLQIIGTDFFRKINKNVWSEATIRKIKTDDSALSILTDARFPDELDAVHEAGGVSIRLTRNSNSKDLHESEIALDNYSNFTYIIDNTNMSIGEQNKAIYKIIKNLDVIPEIN